MSLSLWDDTLFLPVSMIKRRLESQYPISVFKGPPWKVAPLPDRLGGDRNWWPALQAVITVSNAAFFELLRDKAAFLMLPQSIITVLSAPGQVLLSDGAVDAPNAAGQTVANKTGPQPLRIPGAYQGLPQAGYVFGHSDYVGLPEKNYEMLMIIYHEMTHAWMNLATSKVIDDPELRTLAVDGLNAYQDARDQNGNSINPVMAFSESLASYVDEKIGRWCAALASLDALPRLKLSNGDLHDAVQGIVEAYEDESVRAAVGPQTIVSPPLPPELRSTIDRRFLDGLPLTKPFADTKLNDVSNAISNG